MDGKEGNKEEDKRQMKWKEKGEERRGEEEGGRAHVRYNHFHCDSSHFVHHEQTNQLNAHTCHASL